MSELMRPPRRPVKPQTIRAALETGKQIYRKEAHALKLENVIYTDETSLIEVTLPGAYLSKVQFTRANWRDVDFERSLIEHVTIHEGAVSKVDMTGSTISDLVIEDASLDRLRLTHTRIKTLAISNSNFEQCYAVEADISGALLSNIKGTLRAGGSTWHNVKFSGISRFPHGEGFFSFVRADLTDCVFEGCNVDFSFYHATLDHVTFRNCDLRLVNFTGALLFHCRFENCKLEGATFEGARLPNTKFDDPDVLYKVNGMTYVSFPGMSTRNDILTASLDSNGEVYFEAGCFKGSAAEFLQRIEDDPRYEAYREFIITIERLYSSARKAPAADEQATEEFEIPQSLSEAYSEFLTALGDLYFPLIDRFAPLLNSIYAQITRDLDWIPPADDDDPGASPLL